MLEHVIAAEEVSKDVMHLLDEMVAEKHSR
jgi:hypothetical protein